MTNLDVGAFRTVFGQVSQVRRGLSEVYRTRVNLRVSTRPPDCRRYRNTPLARLRPLAPRPSHRAPYQPQKMTLPTMPVKWSMIRKMPAGTKAPSMSPMKNGLVAR